MKYYYDLHIHSCLSPCGDDESTPDSIAGMGELNGLNIMALTDHNTAKNCPAFFEAAIRHNIVPIGGMELTTAEDIHLVCLFDTLQKTMAFDKYIETMRIPIKNRTDIFGNQLLCDAEDNIMGSEENLLTNATMISLEEAPEIVKNYGGICYPAHIDRQSNGIISVLGVFPESPYFSCAEVHDPERVEEFTAQIGKRIVVSSDAHYLWDIKEQHEFFEFSDNENISSKVLNYLRGAV